MTGSFIVDKWCSLVLHVDDGVEIREFEVGGLLTDGNVELDHCGWKARMNRTSYSESEPWIPSEKRNAFHMSGWLCLLPSARASPSLRSCASPQRRPKPLLSPPHASTHSTM
jgi:hypothetical protein